MNLFFKLQSAFWQSQTVTVFKCCLIKLPPYISFEKHIYILVLEMARPGNQHCASCIGTLSYRVTGGCEPDSSSGNMSDARMTSSRPDNGCYGRQLLQPNSVACPQPVIAASGHEIDCRPVNRVPRWPGVDSLVVAYQRHVHGNS